MAWFKAYVTITIDVEASNSDDAYAKAETICNKRVLGASFGQNKNDRGEVVAYHIIEVQDDPPDDE